MAIDENSHREEAVSGVPEPSAEARVCDGALELSPRSQRWQSKHAAPRDGGHGSADWVFDQWLFVTATVGPEGSERCGYEPLCPPIRTASGSLLACARPPATQPGRAAPR